MDDDRQSARDRARAALPSRDEQWQVLLDGLRADVGEPVEVAPGRLEVPDPTTEEPTRTFTVVVTPEQWENVLVDHVGPVPYDYFTDRLGSRDEDERFMVFYAGDLVCSTREKLPPVRGQALIRQMDELRRAHPGDRFGWFAYRPGATDRDSD